MGMHVLLLTYNKGERNKGFRDMPSQKVNVLVYQNCIPQQSPCVVAVGTGF